MPADDWREMARMGRRGGYWWRLGKLARTSAADARRQTVQGLSSRWSRSSFTRGRVHSHVQDGRMRRGGVGP